MIDWKNLEPLPRKKRGDGLDRERLADAALDRKRAKHKGRNHWRNWERRKMALETRKEGLAKAAKRKAAFDRYCDEVHAFWTGRRADHPAKP